MVSLRDDSRRSGGFFFDRNESVQESDELLSSSNLAVQEELAFRKIHTTWIIALMTLLLVCLEVEVFLLPSFLECIADDGPSAYSILLYSKSSLWFIILLCGLYLRRQHYQSRTNGYLEFYRKTRHVRKLPLVILSAGTAVLLVVVTVLSDHCKLTPTLTTPAPTAHCGGLPLTWCNYIQIVVSLEVIITLPILLIYMVWTVRFNRQRLLPDITQEDMILKLSHSTSHTDIGYRDERFIDELVEKQADMIRYLRQHNASLSRRILDLSSQQRDNRHA